MTEAGDQRLEPLLKQIRELGERAREDLEWGRENLSKEQYETFHNRTVDALNKQVERLLGISFER